MERTRLSCTRRGFLGGLASGAIALQVPGVFAQELMRTPSKAKGPSIRTSCPSIPTMTC